MDYKKFAMVLGIMILLPMFLAYFFDAIYPSPEYNDFCGVNRDMGFTKPIPESCNQITSQTLECTAKSGASAGTQLFNCKQLDSVTSKCADVYSSKESMTCSNDGGNPVYNYQENSCCQVFEKCDYCSKNFNTAEAMYNRNLFFIFAPLGLILIVVGIYVATEYLGAGFMFGGLITLFYATIRYFSNMSKLGRAFVILFELIVIIWIGLKKIDERSKETKTKSKRR